MKKLTPGQRRMEIRFHDLVVKKCMGNLTPAERIRLERHQRLRRSYLDIDAIVQQPFYAKQEWEHRKLIKALKRVIHEATK